MSDLDKANPQFTISIRGYDRLQVDEYLARLQRLVAEAEQRAHHAETGGDLSSHVAIGPRVSEIFDLACAEARELRERVSHESSQVLADARAQADAVVAEAEHASRELAQRSRRDHEALLDDLEAERDEVQAEVGALHERRARLISELRRLHEALGGLASLAGGGTDETAAIVAGAGEPSEAPTRAIPEAELPRPRRPQLVAAGRNGSSAA